MPHFQILPNYNVLLHPSEADLVGKNDDEVEMMKTMGFCGFDTTKVSWKI